MLLKALLQHVLMIGTLDYRRLPADVRAATSIEVFKYKLKKWVKSNISVDGILDETSYLLLLFIGQPWPPLQLKLQLRLRKPLFSSISSVPTI
jgi:hypothetical protein